jgi:hypothetical protein
MANIGSNRADSNVAHRWIQGQSSRRRFGRKPALTPHRRQEALQRRAAGEALGSPKTDRGSRCAPRPTYQN